MKLGPMSLYCINNMPVSGLMRWPLVLAIVYFLGCFTIFADEEADNDVMHQLIQALQENTQTLNNWGSLGGEQCRPIQVRREVSPTSIRYTLWYRIAIPASNVSVTWLSSPDPKSAAVFVDESPVLVMHNVWKSMFETTQSGSSSIGVIFRCPEISYDFRLNKSGPTLTESDLIPFHYYLNPNEEIVYGNSVNAQLVVTTTEIVALTVYSHLCEVTANQMIETQQIGWETEPMAIVYRNVESSPIETRIEGQTVFYSLSGLLDVNLRTLNGHGQLVDSLTVSKQLAIRSDSQPLAFPQDFIGFDLHGLSNINDSFAIMECNNEAGDCQLYCDAFGNGLSRLRMYKSRAHLFGGHDVPVRNKIPFGNSYHRMISTDASAENEDEEEARFTCIAENEAGASETLTILVQYHIQVQVLSRIRVEYLTGSRVKVTCIVLGRPAPNVTFALRYEDDYRIVEPSNWLGRRIHARTIAYVLTPLYANRESNTDRLQEVTCSADVTDETGTRIAHDHRSVSIRRSNSHWY